MLLLEYLTIRPHERLSYHLNNSNPHSLLQKMVEEGVAINRDNAFDLCFNEYRYSAGGSAHFDALKQFLTGLCQ